MTTQPSIPRAAAVARIRRIWPDADEIRREPGKCPDCKHSNSLWSYQLPGDGPRGDGSDENCAYWCAACGFGVRGGRPTIDTPERNDER